jgi:hypothetical protein
MDRLNEVILHMKAPPTPKIAIDSFLKLAPDFARLYGCDASQVYRIRTKLNELQNKLKRRGHGVQCAVVSSAIYVLKRITETGVEKSYHDGHSVSDHAFCSAIRRLGYDLPTYKDQALSEALDAGLIPVMSGGTIITFLPTAGDI